VPRPKLRMRDPGDEGRGARERSGPEPSLLLRQGNAAYLMLAARRFRRSRLARFTIGSCLFALAILVGLCGDLAALGGQHCLLHDPHASRDRPYGQAHHAHVPGRPAGFAGIRAAHECPHCPAQSCSTKAPCAAISPSSFAVVTKAAPAAAAPILTVERQLLAVTPHSAAQQPPTPPPLLA